MNEKQRDGMERAGETGEIIDRRAGERRAAAPVVAVVAAEKQRDAFLWLPNLSDLTRYGWSEAYIGESSELVVDAEGNYVKFADVQALASQAQAAVSAPITQREGETQYQTFDYDEQLDDLLEAIARASHKSEWDEGEAISACKRELIGYLAANYAPITSLAAQAAVGVASQQEQQPQPPCNAALRAAPEGRIDAGRAVLDALRNGIPLQEPVSITKAVLAQREARVSLSRGTGPVACAMLVNIQITGWAEGPEKAEAFVSGYNTAFKWYRGALLDLANKAEAELTGRFRAPGGNTNDKASPDLASIASQAQGEVRDALEMAARRVEADCIGFKEDDAQLIAIDRDIRALRATPTES